MTRLTRNTLLLLTGNAGTALLGFGLAIAIGRVLGETGIGVYGVVLAWVFPVRLLAEFGLGTLITRDVAGAVERGPDYLRATLLPRWVLGAAGMVLLWPAAPLLSRDALVVEGLRISAPLILIEPLFGAYTAIFRAEQRMWPVPLLNIGMLAVQMALTVAVLLRAGDVRAVLWVNVLTSAGQLVAAWLIYRGWFRRSLAGVQLHALELLRRAWPFALAAILATLQMRLALILLDQIAATTDAGYYAAAQRFVEGLRLLPMAFFNALLPALAALATQPLVLRRTFGRALGLLVLFGGLCGVGGLWLAGPLVRLTFGPVFDPAAAILEIALWGLLPGLLRGGYTLYRYALGQEGFVNRVLAVAVLIQVGLGLALIPSHGGRGAALAVLLSEVVAAGWLAAGWGYTQRDARPPALAGDVRPE